MTDRQKRTLETRVRRVEKALASLSRTAGTFRPRIKEALLTRLEKKVQDAVGALHGDEQGEFTFADLYGAGTPTDDPLAQEEDTDG